MAASSGLLLPSRQMAGLIKPHI